MIDFSNMIGKPLRHCFTPADLASVTFVFEDGMRRSFGCTDKKGKRGTVAHFATPTQVEGSTFSAVNATLSRINTNRGTIEIDWSASELIELPE